MGCPSHWVFDFTKVYLVVTYTCFFFAGFFFPQGNECEMGVLEWQVELLRLAFGITGTILDTKNTLEEVWKQFVSPDGIPAVIRVPMVWLGAASPVGDAIIKCISEKNGVLIPEVIEGLCSGNSNGNEAWDELDECLQGEAGKALAVIKGTALCCFLNHTL